MNDPLNTLEQHRDVILLAEIGALIHDLGKLSKEFVAARAEVSKQMSFEHHLVLKRLMRAHHPFDPSVGKEIEAKLRSEVKKWAQGMSAPGVDWDTRAKAKGDIWQRLHRMWESIGDKEARRVIREESFVPDDFLPDSLLHLLDSLKLMFRWPSVNEEVLMGDFIETHHSPFAFVSCGQAMMLLAARSNGADAVDSAVDKAGADEGGLKQDIDDTRIATAFGYEPKSLRIRTDKLKKVRHDYANDLALILQRIQTERANLTADPTLSSEFWQEMLYDGWQTADGHEVEGLRKLTETAFRQALGETRRAANDVTLWDHSFSVASLYKAAVAKILLEQARDSSYTFPEVKDIHWRLLRVGYDGLGYLEQAHHVTDLLGRKADLEEALDEVKRTLEVACPLGNEIYRDENGSAFLVPALDGDDKGREIIALVNDTVRQAFLKHLRGEVMPTLSLSQKPSQEATELGWLLAQRAPLSAEPGLIRQSWQGQVGAEICSICGVRPQGYVEPDLPDFARDPDKARKRHLCGVCLARRGRRSQDWARNKEGLLARTIWIDEVADEHGRVALVVGRFGLENWLDGSYISSLLAAPSHPKDPSFARLRRTWETTQRFWKEAETKILDQVLRQEEKRLELTLNPPALPGKFHVYEARYPFVDVPVVWNADKLRLITTTNLRVLGRAPAEWAERLQGSVTLYEPSGYGRASVKAGDFQITGAELSATPYKPYISLLTEPLVFMALMPGAKAVEAARKIRDQYEEEMSRVRDRLPLHLELVFFDYRTPLYAAFDAGRRILAFPNESQMWTVRETDGDDQRRIVFQNKVEWLIPLKMGDGETDDQWYPGSLDSSPPGEQIQVHPSYFEYIFLDTSTRRFDVRLDEETRRRPHPLFGPRHSPRPYLLEDLRRMEQVWRWCWPEGMTTTRLHGIRDLLATRFEEWDLAKKEQTANEWQTYEKLVAQVLGKEFSVYTPGSPAYKGLCQAMLDGLFFDCLELHLQILKEKGVQ